MVTTATKPKNVQLNTTVTPELFAAVRRYRFENEIEKTGDVLKLALESFVAANGITVEEPAAE